MISVIELNDYKLNITNFKEGTADNGKKKISFDFKVRSGEYNGVTTLLYEMTFYVRIPEKEEAFNATIFNYSTSFTNLYEENAIGDFHLELIQVY
ncbi:DUF3219 family protein [Pseudalkalibacillus caeni]|uniref:DUF3219 family protein n=1 Tax=Exobacillus caeni TaxID=2574798 RepID=A0A5R9F0A9_9BACL|nr:DUF3219 family protein [Pseudalkalibacillus caeni]TLS36129.1 DUF3219 family protein [Pseudalkalibacillus caeni]